MSKKVLYTTTTLLLALVVFSFSSCNKGCEIETVDTNSGTILENGIVYASSGGMTGSMAGQYHITGASSYATNFEMSLDGGVTRTTINYNDYSILAFPLIVNCEVAFIREVTVDNVLGTATYKIRVYQCKDPKCDDKRTVENYVLVPAIPVSYTIIYDIDIVES